MSEGMLGRLPLSTVRGPKATLDDRLAGSDGEEWLVALNKFLRRQNPWSAFDEPKKRERKPRPIRHWRKIGDNIIEVNFRTPVILPFDGTVEEWKTARRGWVRVERKGDELYVDGRKVVFHLEPEQLSGSIQGHELRKRLQDKSVLDPRILDALFENQHLIPESCKVDEQGRHRYIYFWETRFHDRVGNLYVRNLYWDGGQWRRNYDCLGNGWGVRRPALILAS